MDEALNDVKFIDLNPVERKRVYIYPDGSELVVENVCRILVRPSGTHRLETTDGSKYIVMAGWRAIRLDVDSWTC